MARDLLGIPPTVIPLERAWSVCRRIAPYDRSLLKPSTIQARYIIWEDSRSLDYKSPLYMEDQASQKDEDDSTTPGYNAKMALNYSARVYELQKAIKLVNEIAGLSLDYIATTESAISSSISTPHRIQSTRADHLPPVASYIDSQFAPMSSSQFGSSFINIPPSQTQEEDAQTNKEVVQFDISSDTDESVTTLTYQTQDDEDE